VLPLATLAFTTSVGAVGAGCAIRHLTYTLFGLFGRLVRVERKVGDGRVGEKETQTHVLAPGGGASKAMLSLLEMRLCITQQCTDS